MSLISTNPQSESICRVVIMAGGTGGHVFPALAVAESLREQGIDVQWLGTSRGIEAQLVPSAQIQLHCIKVEGVRGKSKLSLLLAPIKLLQALWQAAVVLRSISPHAVIGFGGFASGPGGMVAKILGIPLLIHEQNAIAGSTNKLLRPFADKTMQAFKGALAGAETVGNPVRREIAALPAPRQRLAEKYSAKPTGLNIFVLGGSLGAMAINELIPRALALIPTNDSPNIWHQAGRNKAELTSQHYASCGIANARIDDFINDMAAAYSWADLIVCRAGALTVSEISAVGLAALLIPYPWAIDDHQAKNAEVLVSANAAWMRRQERMSAESLAKDLIELMNNRLQLLQMAENARALAQPNSAERVASACLELINAES